MSDLVVTHPLPPALPDADLIRRNRQASKADETKRALAKNWRAFQRWCSGLGVAALPAQPAAVEAYLVYLADQHPVRDRAGRVVGNGLRPASIQQALWSINAMHRLRGHQAPGAHPQVGTALAGILRRKAGRRKQQAPLTIEYLRRVRFPATLKGLRDKALLLVGFAGCLRRSELVRLRAEDVEATPYGLRIYLASSKTDQAGAGAWIDVARATVLRDCCPVQALQAWLEAADIHQGPIFRSLTRGPRPRLGSSLSAVAVDSLVKWAAAAAGLDARRYGGHSLRAGKATYLVERNKSAALVARHGRWKSVDMVLTYYRGEVAAELAGSY